MKNAVLKKLSKVVWAIPECIHPPDLTSQGTGINPCRRWGDDTRQQGSPSLIVSSHPIKEAYLFAPSPPTPPHPTPVTMLHICCFGCQRAHLGTSPLDHRLLHLVWTLMKGRQKAPATWMSLFFFFFSLFLSLG